MAGDGQNGLRNLDLNNLKRELKGAAGRYKAHTRCSKEGRCPPYYIEECISNQLLFCLKPPLKLSSRSVSQHLTELEFSMHNPTLYHFHQEQISLSRYGGRREGFFFHSPLLFFSFLQFFLPFPHYSQKHSFVYKLNFEWFLHQNSNIVCIQNLFINIWIFTPKI